MSNFKAFDWLQILTDEQIDRFELFLRSPYFYSGKLMLSFLQYLRPYLPKDAHDAKALGNKAIFEALQPNKEFKATKVHTWRHELYGLLQQFVAEESSLNTHKTIGDLMGQLDFSAEHNLESGVEDSLKKIERYFATQIHDRSYYYDMFLVEHIKNVQASKQILLPSLAQQYLYLDRLYAFNKLQMIYIELNRCKMSNLSFDLNTHEPFLTHLVANNFWDDNTLKFHYYQLKIIHAPNEELYGLLKNELKEEANKLHPTEVRNVRTILANFCVQQIKQGNVSFYNDYLGILLDKVEHEQIISIVDFKNIITVALRIKDTDWICAFLENHKSIITPPEAASDAYQYNLARVYFLQKKYDDALELLSLVKIDNVYYSVEIKILTIKILYEQINANILSGKKLINKEEELELKTEGFKSYLQMTKKLNTVPESTVLAWKEFSRFLRRIVPLLLTEAYDKAYKVKKDFEATEARGIRVVENDWLLEKINEMTVKATRRQAK